MNNKYQESLNKIIRSCCPYCYDDNGCQNCEIKQICNATAKSWVDTLQELVDKESKYQSLEEELGISLPILFKALKNGIIVELDDEKDELDGWRLSISFEQKCFVFINFWGKFGIDFKDYGKTWWLKEDLKSE